MSGLVTRESILSAMYVRASLFSCFCRPDVYRGFFLSGPLSSVIKTVYSAIGVKGFWNAGLFGMRGGGITWKSINEEGSLSNQLARPDKFNGNREVKLQN